MSFEHASYSSSLQSLPINKSWRIGLVNDVTISPNKICIFIDMAIVLICCAFRIKRSLVGRHLESS